MTLLAEYVLRLASDRGEAEEFAASTESAKARMAEAGLSNDQQQLLLEGNSGNIVDAISDELQASSGQAWNHTTCMVTFDIPKP